MNKLVIVGLAAVALAMASCRSAYFPVCAKLAQTKPSPVQGISSTLYKVCIERHIKIKFVTATVVQLRGSRKNMRWLQSNYPHILCDFDQSQVAQDESTYTSCMAHAREWIRIVQGNRPDTLMSARAKYCPNCCL